jgi:hypothetical protein
VEVRLLVGILPRESQGELEGPEPARVLIGRVAAERVSVVPAPDGPLLLVGNEARGVQVIGVTKLATKAPPSTSGHHFYRPARIFLASRERPERYP